MKLALPKFLIGLFASHAEDEDDREDIEYIRMAKEEGGTPEPLRDVLAEIRAQRSGDIHRPVTPAS